MFAHTDCKFMGLWQVEKVKQDDAFEDLSNILGDLKGMAIDMGSEIERSVIPPYLTNTFFVFFFFIFHFNVWMD